VRLEGLPEHRAAGTFLFRTLEAVETTYPSLVAAARRSPTPRHARPDEGGALGELDGDEPTGDDALADESSHAADA
jgi:hypothetical protein